MNNLVLMPDKLLVSLFRVTENDLKNASSLYVPSYALDESSSTGRYKVKDVVYRNAGTVILSSRDNIPPNSVVYLSNAAMNTIDLYRFIPLDASLRSNDDLFLIPITFVDAFETR